MVGGLYKYNSVEPNSLKKRLVSTLEPAKSWFQRLLSNGPTCTATARGFWNLLKDGEPPPTAVAHVVGVGGSKPYIMMAYGWWAPTTSPDLRGRRFITASPPLKPVRTESMADFYELLTRLAAVAVQAGGVAVVPLVDCASPWIVRNHDKTWMGVVPIAHQGGATLVVPTRCPFSRSREEVCCHFLPRDVTCMGHRRKQTRRMVSMGEFLVGRTRESLLLATGALSTLNVDDAVAEAAAEGLGGGGSITTATVADAIVAKLPAGNATAVVVLEGVKNGGAAVNLLPPVGFTDASASTEWRRFSRFPLCQLEEMKAESSLELEDWHAKTARDYKLHDAR